MEFGSVNKILTASFVDGPGNRAVVFLQGCNLNCLYCHNPYTINECNHCGACVNTCPADALEIINGKVFWIPEKCTECDTCINVCPHSSSPKVRQMAADEIWEEIDPSVPFLSGVSVSGGEPLLQIPFLVEFFQLIHEKSSLTTLIETNGFVDQVDLKIVLPHVDLVQIDLKCSDESLHEELTGQPFENIKESIRTVYDSGKLYSIQQVIVDGFTSDEEQIKQTADILTSIDSSIPLRLVKFRPHGVRNAAADWQVPSDEKMIKLQQIVIEKGLSSVRVSL